MLQFQYLIVMDESDFVLLTDFINHYSISLAEALKTRLRYDKLEKFFSLDISYYRSQQPYGNAIRQFLTEISAEYGKSKTYRPIDLSTHPSWQEAKAAEDDVRQAAALARKILKIPLQKLILPARQKKR